MRLLLIGFDMNQHIFYFGFSQNNGILNIMGNPMSLRNGNASVHNHMQIHVVSTAGFSDK